MEEWKKIISYPSSEVCSFRSLSWTFFFLFAETRMQFYVAMSALLIVFLSLFSRRKYNSSMLPSSNTVWGMSEKCPLLLEKLRGVAMNWYLISSILPRKGCCSFPMERRFLQTKTHHNLFPNHNHCIGDPTRQHWCSMLDLVTFFVRCNCLRLLLK